ncbi:diguanylate cyclase domain-containing protein, partial [Methylobacterium nigriterrae]|uniref:diguanylate cyclase domain-containing protein n=1 Tax=Methylobacterium nigriterrae TaxID=3127512 RepID=UPI003013B5A1
DDEPLARLPRPRRAGPRAPVRGDSAGHTAGDRCLIAVAAAIQAAMPPGAFAGRYGGEEFIAILPAGRSRGRDRSLRGLRTFPSVSAETR